MKISDKKIYFIIAAVSFMIIIIGLGIGYNFRRSRNNQNVRLGDVSCSVVSGPEIVYDTEMSYVSDCSKQQTSGSCYELAGTADTSYCGSDDGVDCYRYRKYIISCQTIQTTCYKLEHNSCSEITVNGSSCSGYYSSYNACINAINCDAGEYKNGSKLYRK